MPDGKQGKLWEKIQSLTLLRDECDAEIERPKMAASEGNVPPMIPINSRDGQGGFPLCKLFTC